MTAINEYDYSARYADGRTPHDDADYDDTPPAPRTPEQQSRERRRFTHLIDPWAPVPAWYVDGACVGCGGKNGHGGSCPVYLGGGA